MIRKLIILTVLIVSVQCFADAPIDEVAALRAELAATKAELNKIKYANVLAIEKQIEQTPVDWKSAYGDTKETQFYFNIRSAWIHVEQCKTAIRHLANAITNIANPDDPNSLTSRIERLEARPVYDPNECAYRQITEPIDPIHFDITETVPCEALDTVDGNKALKPEDPNEVAK